MNRELVSNMFSLRSCRDQYCMFFFPYFYVYFYFILSLAHRTTQTPAASSLTAKTTSLGLADQC